MTVACAPGESVAHAAPVRHAIARASRGEAARWWAA